MNCFQIEPEEAFLTSSFPVDYPCYKANVRRRAVILVFFAALNHHFQLCNFFYKITL
jgi:protein-S-isoprenylcysteine O-methyltransferase Ste14